MILPLLMPFNAIKATLNAALIMMLYKPISTLLKRAKITDVAPHSPVDGEVVQSSVYKLGKKSILIVVLAIAVAVLCITLFLTVFGGEINWIKDISKK